MCVCETREDGALLVPVREGGGGGRLPLPPPPLQVSVSQAVRAATSPRRSDPTQNVAENVFFFYGLECRDDEINSANHCAAFLCNVIGIGRRFPVLSRVGLGAP